MPGVATLLHARGQVGRLADRGVVDAEIAVDGPDPNLAGVQTDPDLHRDALDMQGAIRRYAEEVWRTERGIAGAHGVVLMGERRPEERHDPVAHHLVDGALRAVDSLHHPLEHRVEKLAASSGSRSASNPMDPLK